MSVEENFNIAVKKVKTLGQRPTDTELLKLYGLYKTVMVGKVNTPRPGTLDLKGRKKYEMWEKYQSVPKEEAMSLYSRHVALLILNYSPR